MSNNDELTQERFWEILSAIPEPEPASYRLYYDSQGLPLFYSMEAVPGTYIEITKEQFVASATNVRVRDGKLVEVKWVTTEVLAPSDTGTPCHPDNIAIVVDIDREHQRWSKRTYEQN